MVFGRRIAGAALAGATLLIASLVLPPAAAQVSPATNVIVVSLDGLRWQEVFGGLSPVLLTKDDGGVEEAAALERRFGGAEAETRRARLLPFFWSVVAKQGQVFGDASRGSLSRVTNGLWFSYPGYNEMFAGAADARIASNDRVANPNVTVLEWLNRRPGFHGRVAAFASWELLPWIFNAERSGLVLNGEGPPVADATTERERLLNDFAADLPPLWGPTRFDAPTAHGALEHLRTHRPRVLYVMLGETDMWAHERRYDLYLDAAERNDRLVRRLWDAAQSIPEYAGRTALLLVTDHGRGDTAADWIDHGRKVPAAERVWMAVMGPRVAPLGIRQGTPTTLSQVAAMIAALVGEDFRKDVPSAAPPVPFAR